MCVMQQEEKMHNFREEQCTYHVAVVSSKALAVVKGAVCIQEQAIFFYSVEKGAGNCYKVGMLTSYVQSSNRSLHYAGPKTRKQQKYMTRLILAKLPSCLPHVSP